MRNICFNDRDVRKCPTQETVRNIKSQLQSQAIWSILCFNDSWSSGHPVLQGWGCMFFVWSGVHVYIIINMNIHDDSRNF